MMQKLLLSLALAFQFTFACAQSVTYVANSGVMIEYSASKILIDVLFDQYNLKLDAPDPSTLNRMIAGNSPYNGVDLVLVTHAARDHFNGQYGVDYLKKNSNVRMIATPQALDSMKSFADSFDGIKNQLTIHPWKRAWKQVNQENIIVKSIYTRHASRNFKMQNQIFLITIGDKKILHIGDTQMEPDNFENLRLIYEDIDLAIVPFWFMSSVYGAELIKDYINPKKVVGVSFPKTGGQAALSKIKTQFPKSKVLRNKGERVSF